MNTTSSFDLVCRDIQRSIAVDPYNALCTLIYAAVASKLQVSQAEDHAKRIKLLLKTSGEVNVKGLPTAKVGCTELYSIIQNMPDKAFDALCYGVSLLNLTEGQKDMLLAFALILDESVESIINSDVETMLDRVQEKV